MRATNIERCTYCKRQVFRDAAAGDLQLTKDHTVPRSQGARETVPACKFCNQLKRDVDPEDWAAFCAAHPQWWTMRPIPARRALEAFMLQHNAVEPVARRLGALFDTRRRHLGLSIGETAVVCGRAGEPIAERTVNRWINDATPVPDRAIAALEALEETMDDAVTRLAEIAADRTMAGPILVRRYRTQADLEASPDDLGIPLGAHAVMTAWLEARLSAEGIDAEIRWADEL